MPTIDGWLEGLLHGTNVSLGVGLLISLLLGLRHASDPDHPAAVLGVWYALGALGLVAYPLERQPTPFTRHPVRPARRAISAACRLSSSRSSGGRRTSNGQRSPARTHAIHPRSEVEERMSTLPSASSSTTPIGGTCSRTSSNAASSNTSTDQRSWGIAAEASSTCCGVSKPGGRTNVSPRGSASKTLSSLKRRNLSLRWS